MMVCLWPERVSKTGTVRTISKSISKYLFWNQTHPPQHLGMHKRSRPKKRARTEWYEIKGSVWKLHAGGTIGREQASETYKATEQLALTGVAIGLHPTCTHGLWLWPVHFHSTVLLHLKRTKLDTGYPTFIAFALEHCIFMFLLKDTVFFFWLLL